MDTISRPSSDVREGPPQTSDVDTLVRQMRDYCHVGIDLVWQRQVIFLAAVALAGFYYDLGLAITILVMISLSEMFDFWLFRKVLRSQSVDRRTARQFLLLICVSTVFSAMVIITYAVGIAILQGQTTHFMPLFFLFAAALFAAMNNHQLLPVLFLRLAMYGIAFLFIPIRDVVITQAPIRSELWAQLFTSVFVLFFIVDCSRIYLRFYRSQIAQFEALRKEHELSQAAYKAKSEFVSTMSHELRTPLTAIKGSIDMMQSGKLGELPDQAKLAVGLAQKNSDRLLNLISEILDLQSVEANAMQFNIDDIDVLDAIRDAVSQIRPYSSRLDVEIHTELPCEPIFVKADRKRLIQVFLNIVSNASKFSPPGSRVRIEVEDQEADVAIKFIDEGIGLSEEDHGKVFDPFTQIDSSDTRKIGGTGLGMNISKRIIDALHGTISYRRNETIGTTFFVTLPRIAPVAQA